jgi:hypothetical protein
VLVQDRCILCAKRTIGSEILFNALDGMTWVMWNLILVCLETLLVSVQDRCTVCTKHTMCSEIVLDAPDGTPR